MEIYLAEHNWRMRDGEERSGEEAFGSFAKTSVSVETREVSVMVERMSLPNCLDTMPPHFYSIRGGRNNLRTVSKCQSDAADTGCEHPASTCASEDTSTKPPTCHICRPTSKKNNFRWGKHNQERSNDNMLKLDQNRKGLSLLKVCFRFDGESDSLFWEIMVRPR